MDKRTSQITIPFPASPQSATATVTERKSAWPVSPAPGAAPAVPLAGSLSASQNWSMTGGPSAGRLGRVPLVCGSWALLRGQRQVRL